MRPSAGSAASTPDPCLSVHVALAIEELAPFYEEAEALEWLATPQPLLGHRCALELLAEREGRRTVFAMIAQLRDSVYV